MIYKDGEYRFETKEDWQEKMRRYFQNENSKDMAVHRVRLLCNGGCWDWDDNVPAEWAEELAVEFGI